MSNNTSTQSTSFWCYINNHRIEIPIIQRDYAQGRLGKEYLRKSFLTSIKDALDGDSKQKLELDFVYGSTIQDKMHPLDGQQRLTTMWLLHWYIALRAGCLDESTCSVLKKFSYETRISSRKFCEQLCIPKNFESFTKGGIVDFITNQTWFYSAWKQDPTIQSMLRMLGGTKINNNKGDDIIDGMEELFHDTDQTKFEIYWNALLSENAPIIFYHLPLKDFGLSDDLYIKMNARGMELTAFENFKADLIGYIKKQKDEVTNETRRDWENLLDPQDGIPHLLDTTWTDIFWKSKSIGIKDQNGKIQKANRIDEIYFAFINRFFWNQLFVFDKNANDKNATKPDYLLPVGDGILKDGSKTRTIENYNLSFRHLNEDNYYIYSDFTPYAFYIDESNQKSIPISLFNDLCVILQNWADYTGPFPTCKWNDEFKFIPEYVKDKGTNYNIEFENNNMERILKINSLNQTQRIVFFAVCKYFKEGKADQISLRRWMRVVWNLVSGEDQDGRSQIRNSEAMRNAMRRIDALNSHDVYRSLKTLATNDDSEFEKRLKEEQVKAKQILDENNQLRKYYGCCTNDTKQIIVTWEDIIIEAENYAFFKGSIRFLYQDANGCPNWNDFDTKWMNAQKYFDVYGVKDNNVNGIRYKTEAILLKAVLYHAKDFWKLIEPQKFVFDNKSGTWKSNILLEKGWEEAVHEIMMNNLQITERDDDCLMYKNLYDSNLLEYVSFHQSNSRIRWIHSHRALYPPRYEGILLDDDKNSFFRNQVLSDLMSSDEITSDNRINGCNFFRGWDVNFTYIKDEKQYSFQWNTNNHVYLMSEGKPEIKDETKESRIEKYYCFDVSDVSDEDTLLQLLLQLINQYENAQLAHI